MKTGFYNLRGMTNRKLKAFFKDAIMLSYDSHVEKLDCNVSIRRMNCTDKTLLEMIDNSGISNHNVCIDRSVQYPNNEYGEIGYSTLHGSVSFLLYIFLTLPNLKKLTEKYQLIME